MPLPSSETALMLKMFSETRKMRYVLSPTPKTTCQCPRRQFSARSRRGCLPHHDPEILWMIPYGSVIHTATPVATMVITLQPCYLGITP